MGASKLIKIHYFGSSSGIPKTDRVLVGEGSEKSEDLEDVTS